MQQATCATCRHWRGNPQSYRAACGIAAVYGNPAFDESCAQHTPRRTVLPITHVIPAHSPGVGGGLAISRYQSSVADAPDSC